MKDDELWPIDCQRCVGDPVGKRQALTQELCLNALQKGDVVTAREWHLKSRGGILDKYLRILTIPVILDRCKRQDHIAEGLPTEIMASACSGRQNVDSIA